MIELKCMKELMLKKTDGSRECIIFHYWYFLNINFTFQPGVCNRCHCLRQKANDFNDVAIVTVKGNDYKIHFLYMSKDEAINLLRNADLTEKNRIFRINSALVLKKSLIANLSTIKLLKTKIKLQFKIPKFTAIKLQIFMINKNVRQALIILA